MIGVVGVLGGVVGVVVLGGGVNGTGAELFYTIFPSPESI